jgi:signal recognition particle GTPase
MDSEFNNNNNNQSYKANYHSSHQGRYKGHQGKYYGNKNYYKQDYYQKSLENQYTSNDQNEQNFEKQGNNNKFYNKSYGERNNYDPYTVQAMIYRAEMYILTKYPQLVDLNVKNEGISKTLDENSRFYIIKSFSEEDVHKAIKYNVWSSTKTGNQTLSNSYRATKEKGGFVYLFFSTNGSGRYVGIARMKGEVDEEKQFLYWTQDSKWTGLFDIEWVFIKDVPFKCFKNIFITMK